MEQFDLFELKLGVDPETEEIIAESRYNSIAFPDDKYGELFEKIVDCVVASVQTLIDKQYGGNQ